MLYKYPLDGTAELLNISIGEKNPSPGTVLQAQVPEQKRKIKLDKEKPVIEDLTDRKPVRPAESIESRADIRDRSLVKTAAFTTGQMKTNRLSAFSLKKTATTISTIILCIRLN